MTNPQLQVALFMVKAGQDVPMKPMIPDAKTQQLRLSLHLEEAFNELKIAFKTNDIVAVADSIADSLVVILGTACACGIAIEPIFNEVMRSNMTKFIDGHRREDGKWIKGPSYSPANIQPLIKAQS